MEERLYNLHLEAGRRCGIEHTCGQKINYHSEENASKAANAMNSKGIARHKLEPYPCAFCNGWHVGRVMSEQELIEINTRVRSSTE